MGATDAKGVDMRIGQWRSGPRGVGRRFVGEGAGETGAGVGATVAAVAGRGDENMFANVVGKRVEDRVWRTVLVGG